MALVWLMRRIVYRRVGVITEDETQRVHIKVFITQEKYIPRTRSLAHSL